MTNTNERAQTLLREYEALRQRMLQLLQSNDANGNYTDAEHDAQGWDRNTVDECAAMLREALATGAVQGMSHLYSSATTLCGPIMVAPLASPWCGHDACRAEWTRTGRNPCGKAVTS